MTNDEKAQAWLDALAMIQIASIAFESKQPDRGYTVRASYLKPPHDAASLIEIFKYSKPVRKFFFPAYRIWNVAAHLRDIVDSEIANNTLGYDMALCGTVFVNRMESLLTFCAGKATTEK